MKSSRICCLALLLLIAIHGNVRAAMQLIYPAEKSWVRRSDYLILKTNNEAISGVKITVNGIDSDILDIGSKDYQRVFQDILIVQPVWDKGKNTLLIEGFKGSEKLETIGTEVYFEPAGDRALVPKEYHDNQLHTPDMDKICTPCHAAGEGGGEVAAGGKRNSPCAVCHQNMVKVKYVHEPVRSFTCTYCHVGEGTSRFKVVKQDAPLCFECHSDKADDIKKFTFSHGPVAAGYCVICHDPHGTDFPAFMRRPINEVCLSCHEKIGKTPHVIGAGGSAGHPLSGRPDISPKRKGKELSCASCHDPHGGVVRYFFTSRTKERMALCQFCHAK